MGGRLQQMNQYMLADRLRISGKTRGVLLVVTTGDTATGGALTGKGPVCHLWFDASFYIGKK